MGGGNEIDALRSCQSISLCMFLNIVPVAWPACALGTHFSQNYINYSPWPQMSILKEIYVLFIIINIEHVGWSKSWLISDVVTTL